MEIPVIYEDKNIAVLNKPAGINTHPDGRNAEPALSDWVANRWPETKAVGEPLSVRGGKKTLRPGIVHRLDKETSGLLIVAKNQVAFRHLKKQFQTGAIKKEYRALVHGVIKNNKGEIASTIGRSRKDPRRRAAGEAARPSGRRPAITRYLVLERFPNHTFLSLWPLTGRTHQLRVHLKSIGHPVVGDRLYASAGAALGGLDRQALHATGLEFFLLGGLKLKLEVEPPADFLSCLAELRRL